MTKAEKPTVCVLMSVYNGAKYLEEQLQSLVAQEGVDQTILVRDDGSTDGSHEILNRWQETHKITWYAGGNLGPARSFLDLLERAPKADFFAFCDQDDVWLTDKLLKATDALRGEGKAAMYCSAFQMVDAELNPIDTKRQKHQLVFAQSLVSNYVTGCTVVMNKVLVDILKQHHPTYLMMHDSWVVKSCLAIGGKVIYDQEPHILYRQHGGNVIGGASSKKKKMKRRWQSVVSPQRGRYQEAMSLLVYEGRLTHGNAELLNKLKDYYRKSLIYRIRLAKSFVSGDASRDRLMRWAFILKQF